MGKKIKTKKADSKKLLLAFIVLIFCFSLGIVGYTLSIGTLSYVGDIVQVTGESDLMKRDGFTGNFEIIDVSFHMSNSTITEGVPGSVCEEDNKKLPMVADIRILSENVGKNCRFFVNNAYVSAINIKNLPENETKLNETVYTTSLKKHDIFSTHEIRVCCHTECYKKELTRLC
ncbi:MAG: hypothetical protein ACOCZQ_01735 [Nanoarchaeota archaeon]